MKDFLLLRKWFFEQLHKILETEAGMCHKSYEGTFEISFQFPCIFEKEEEPTVAIHLDCYLVGPGRHYAWTGRTMKEAIKSCKKDLKRWLKEDYGDILK